MRRYFHTNQNYDFSSFDWYKCAAEQGNAEAQFYVGMDYLTRHNVKVKKDIGRAEKFLTLAANQGKVDAQYQLGKLYYSQKKFNLAEKFLLLAANQGSINAMGNLGYLYRDRKNLKDAILWFEKEIALDKNSAFDTGCGLVTVLKTNPNLADPKRFAALCLANDNMKVYLKTIDALKSHLTQDQLQVWYTAAAETNDATTRCSLARIYRWEGNLCLAKELYESAIKLGFNEAKSELQTLLSTNPSLIENSNSLTFDQELMLTRPETQGLLESELEIPEDIRCIIATNLFPVDHENARSAFKVFEFKKLQNDLILELRELETHQLESKEATAWSVNNLQIKYSKTKTREELVSVLTKDLTESPNILKDSVKEILTKYTEKLRFSTPTIFPTIQLILKNPNIKFLIICPHLLYLL